MNWPSTRLLDFFEILSSLSEWRGRPWHPLLEPGPYYQGLTPNELVTKVLHRASEGLKHLSQLGHILMNTRLFKFIGNWLI